jgi:type I restriction enzyme, S subunit
MMKTWVERKLGDVCDFQGGSQPAKSNFIFKPQKGYVRFLQIRDFGSDKNITYIPESKKNRYCNEEDILLGRYGASVGKVLVNKAGAYNVAIMKTIPNEEIISKGYLFYYLISNEFQVRLSLVASRSAQDGFSKDDIFDFPILVPPLSEQHRIVKKLDTLFADITKAKDIAEQNLKNAKELFECYLQGVFENGNWEKKKWGELCDFVRGPFGGSLKKNIFKESGYVVYEQKHAIHDHFKQLRYFIDEEKFNEMRRFEVFPGDIIMSCSGVTLGRVAVVPEGIPQGIINQALLKLTPKKNVSVHYLKHWLRSNIFQTIIFDYSGGAAIPNVPSAKILKDIKIPCPIIKEQERIVNEIETVLNETKRLESIYQKKKVDLEELKKSILQKAFAGELKTEKAVAV